MNMKTTFIYIDKYGDFAKVICIDYDYGRAVFALIN